LELSQRQVLLALNFFVTKYCILTLQQKTTAHVKEKKELVEDLKLLLLDSNVLQHGKSIQINPESIPSHLLVISQKIYKDFI
jgi:hypothetical protein